MAQGTIEVRGLEERIQMFSEASTKNPMMRKRINEVIRRVLNNVRSQLQKDARSGLQMESDPRQAYKAIRRAVYRRIFGGQVNILSSKQSSNGNYYEPPRKLRQGQRGGNRRTQSERTKAIMSYQGNDRGFILRFLNQGATNRETRYGNRGSIAARNWFGPRSLAELEKAASQLDLMIDDIVAGVMK